MALHALPAGSTDCHVHAFGDPAAFPFDAARSYTPGRADAGQLRAFLDAHGLDRVVLVQPSVYGTDNRCTLDAVGQLGERARAVLVLDPGIDDANLADLHARGARGVRLNLHTSGMEDTRQAAATVDTFAGRLRGSGWHLQVFAAHGVLAALGPNLARAGLPVVLDHFGLVGRGSTVLGKAADTLLRLVATDGLHVKLSAPHRVVPDPEAAPELAALVRRLARSAPEGLLWGSDWPHTASTRRSAAAETVEPFESIDDRRALERLSAWIGDEGATHRMLVANPTTLYGFAAIPKAQ
ncbi:amidohydrolase family protein [Roseomonas chloroacetimidivorans]|uniref:amidohydrolase family protein n=1 Tax=Roseomonas chloroacetimidivorans TaxID=1766656 RepID=UPI003C792A44